MQERTETRQLDWGSFLGPRNETDGKFIDRRIREYLRTSFSPDRFSNQKTKQKMIWLQALIPNLKLIELTPELRIFDVVSNKFKPYQSSRERLLVGATFEDGKALAGVVLSPDLKEKVLEGEPFVIPDLKETQMLGLAVLQTFEGILNTGGVDYSGLEGKYFAERFGFYPFSSGRVGSLPRIGITRLN